VPKMCETFYKLFVTVEPSGGAVKPKKIVVYLDIDSNHARDLSITVQLARAADLAGFASGINVRNSPRMSG
jgi:hypothetical protein